MTETETTAETDAVETKSCPHCASEINADASKCPECGGAVGTEGAVFAGVVATLLFGFVGLVFEPALYGALVGLLFTAWIVFVGPDQ